MSLIEQIKNLLNRANDDVKNHYESMSGVEYKFGCLKADISNDMKDVGIDSTIDEDFAKYDAEVCQGMYEFAIDQLKIKIAEAKQKGASAAELTRLHVSVWLTTAGVRRHMTVYAYDDRPRTREKPDVQHYGVASYNTKVRAEYMHLDAFTKGEKQIKEALEA